MQLTDPMLTRIHAHPVHTQSSRKGSHGAQNTQDLYVGGRLEVFNRAFELTDADEYTYSYMENNKHIFVMADAEAILASLRVQVGLKMQGGVAAWLRGRDISKHPFCDGGRRGDPGLAARAGVLLCVLALMAFHCLMSPTPTVAHTAHK